MTEFELKAKLERALHRRLTQAEWRHLKRAEVVRDYEKGNLVTDADENWREFRESATEHLGWLRCFEKDRALEQSGELGTGPESEPNADTSISAPVPLLRDNRTSARASAMSALNRLRVGNEAWQEILASGRAVVSGFHLPRGGVDGTLPQWVILLAVEAWVPAEEVKEVYRDQQQTLLAERKPPRTHERAFQVAAFVWEQEHRYGERPQWPVLCERWNNWPLTEPFERWRDFRTNFYRGEKAVRPRYVAREELIIEQVRSGAPAKGFDLWASSLRE